MGPYHHVQDKMGVVDRPHFFFYPFVTFLAQYVCYNLKITTLYASETVEKNFFEKFFKNLCPDTFFCDNKSVKRVSNVP
jgi:hypothetical protein